MVRGLRSAKKSGEPELGQIRTSQLITTWGPGSIVDLPGGGSFVVRGLEGWQQGDTVEEPNLRAILHVRQLRLPGTTKSRKDIPVARFPEWFRCHKCERLIRQPFCERSGCSVAAPPARFIVICRNGHMDDFPWAWWLHRGHGTCPEGVGLHLEDSTGSNTLADLWVSCDTCKERRSLKDALAPRGFNDYACTRRRPWLGDVDPDPCRGKPSLTGVLRGASNVYFGSVLGALSLPRHSSAIHVILKDDWPTLLKIRPERRSGLLEDLLDGTGFSVQDGLTAIEQHQKVVSDQKELRSEEYLALRGPHQSVKLGLPPPYFQARNESVPDRYQWLLSSVSLVDRLREVRALHGFTRVESLDPESPMPVKTAPLSAGGTDWLPVSENYGEGIFVVVSPTLLSAWAARTAVTKRAKAIADAYDRWRKERELPPSPDPVGARLVALHGLAHLLIRQLSLYCGYGISSIRERVYHKDDQSGILIYTAAADSDGSLGGLVSFGRRDRFKTIIDGAIEAAEWCSQDPLCLDREPDAGGHLNGAACHACLLLPETSCELGNRFLDRRMLIESHTPVDGLLAPALA